MQAKNVTTSEMYRALDKINEKYHGNVIFNRFDGNGFTLKVRDCNGPGSRHGFSKKANGDYRRTSSACWHVHGDFFDALLKINPEAVVISSINRGKIRIEVINGMVVGNWEDWQVGSMYNPLYMSEMCGCE